MLQVFLFKHLKGFYNCFSDAIKKPAVAHRSFHYEWLI